MADCRLHGSEANVPESYARSLTPRQSRALRPQLRGLGDKPLRGGRLLTTNG